MMKIMTVKDLKNELSKYKEHKQVVIKTHSAYSFLKVYEGPAYLNDGEESNALDFGAVIIHGVD